MPTWLDLSNEAIVQKLNEASSGASHIPDEDEPYTTSERDIGLRIFRKGVGKIYAKDLASGLVGSGTSADEALADLRGQLQTT